MEEITRRATKRPDANVTELARTPDAGILTEVMHFETSAANQFLDLTDDVREHVARSEVRHGQVTVMTPHTTMAVAVNESETGFLNDFRRAIAEMVPVEGYYEHDDHEVRTENLQEDEFINGHSHVRQLLTGSTSVNIPVVEGELVLGRWQRIMLIELDQPRSRRAILHTQGL